uniref:Uncharacterized protein n=1 Tax=uncultured prokaryote TaxID=198431 RepID=A0A0H5PWY5_9ZZZZ|nr:unnamed protein product [uncultured bacterium]CRY93694.1 hypothetical protein [uncultured prokaryote]
MRDWICPWSSSSGRLTACLGADGQDGMSWAILPREQCEPTQGNCSREEVVAVLHDTCCLHGPPLLGAIRGTEQVFFFIEFLCAFCHSPDKTSLRLWFAPDVAPSGVFLCLPSRAKEDGRHSCRSSSWGSKSDKKYASYRSSRDACLRK